MLRSIAEVRMVRRAEAKAAKPTKPVERDLEVLHDLSVSKGEYEDGWCRPLDIGGHDGSDHSYRLTRLVHAGLADQRQRGALVGSRGSKSYRINDAGRAKITELFPRTTQFPSKQEEG